MDVFTLDPNFALLLILPLLAVIAGAIAVNIAQFFRDQIATIMGWN